MHSKLSARLRKKLIQTQRLSHKTKELLCLVIGAGLVALATFSFAQLADLALELNQYWASHYGYLCFIILPLGLALLAWATKKFAPYSAGSGIPQVIASINLPYSHPNKSLLIAFPNTLWKIPLTFLAMLCGASVGREGPSVQVGAAVMLAWGQYCRRHKLAFKGLTINELIAAGAAGGLAAAFNAPLAGIIFAIEELGRGTLLRWGRRVLFVVLIAGLMLVAIQGNNPYFPRYQGANSIEHILLWLLACGLVCGILGGLFSYLLAKGIGYFLSLLRAKWLKTRPIYTALLLGFILALIGFYCQGQSYGTGYNLVTTGLDNQPLVNQNLGLFKLCATVLTYWSGIAGGIFTPALAIGSGLGYQLWAITGAVADQPLLVLLCMAGFLAAATQSPVTSAVIVMEMTGGQSLLFWLLMTSLVASLIARQFCPKPFYHLMADKYRQTMNTQCKN